MQTKDRSRLRIPIALLTLALIVSAALNVVVLLGWALMAGGHSSARQQAEDEYPQLKEVWSYGQGTVKAARIALSGVIIRGGAEGFFDLRPDRVEDTLRQIRAAQQDAEVKAIILEVDSPGGGITPTDEIYRALCEFRASAAGRRVVDLVRGTAASGGYYIALAADWIIAEPTALLGSISVLIQTLNWKALSDKVGIEDITIKSGRHKDLLNPFRAVDPEQLSMLQATVDSLHAHFVDILRQSRPQITAPLEELCDGRIFTAPAAQELQLIDQQGYWADAMARAAQLTGQTNLKVVRYKERSDLTRWLAEWRAPTLRVSLPGRPGGGPQLMYLWQP
jgi:protease-4